MSLQLEQHQHGAITILRLTKYLRGEADATYLLAIIDQLLASERNQILVNLKDLTSIDSAGLGALAEAHAKVKKASGVIKIVNAAQRHTELLILSRLASIFPSFKDEETAIKSFTPDPEDEVKHFDILEFVREVNQAEQRGHREDRELKKEPAAEQPATGQE